MSHAHRADRLLIKPAAGARPAPPRTHGQIFPKARPKRPVPRRVTCGTTSTRLATAPDRQTDPPESHSPPMVIGTLPRMPESAVPILPSRNLEETLEFYSRLGFELQGAPIEKYRYLIIGRGSVELHFWDAPDVDPLTTDASCYIRVDDADALHREWLEVGIQSDPATGSRLMPPVDTDYGIREFALVDRSGNLVRVGSPLHTSD